jgi:hypothetical protein
MPSTNVNNENMEGGKPYQTPQLTIYGTIAQMTQLQASGPIDDNPGKAPSKSGIDPG